MKKSPLFVLFITIFIDMLGFGIIIPILPIFSKELGAADYQVGLIAMIFPIMNFLFAPLWGTLSDRHGRRPIMLISIFITSIAYFVFSQVTVLWILFFSRLLSGVGSANISVAQAYITDVTSPAERTKSLGFLGAAFGIGFIMGPPLGGWLKSISTSGTVDWVGYVACGMCVVNLVMAYFLLPESLKEKKINVPFNFKVVTGIITELKKPMVGQLLWINFIFITAFMLMQISCSLMWKEITLLDEKQIGYVFAFIGVATAVVQGLLVGRMVKAFGETKMLTYGIIFMAVGLAILPLTGKTLFVPVQFIGLALIALANGCLTPSITSLLSKFANQNEVGHVLGVSQSFGSVARAVGMGLSGFLYSVQFAVPFVVGVVLMLTCFVFTKKLKRETVG
ncbi:MAG: MFS transporter [Chryseotalea sp. WA131a]|nr:MAG: MFS transporter [Chryseotalea sp. WA131a]